MCTVIVHNLYILSMYCIDLIILSCACLVCLIYQHLHGIQLKSCLPIKKRRQLFPMPGVGQIAVIFEHPIGVNWG